MSMSENWKHPIGRLRVLGMIEGASFVLLMGLGMPMKYMMAQPLGVKILGPLHGALFVWLCVEIAQAVFGKDWPIKRGAVVFFASLFPFGPFLIDSWLKKQQAAFADEE